MARKTVAVMQPYFFPYAGYFRLFAAADEFVIYDCVQFPRRGRVHRTEVPGPGGGAEWLTLPLARQPRETRIRDLAFSSEARSDFDRRLARLRWLRDAGGPAADRVRAFLHGPMIDVAGFLEAGLRLVNELLGVETLIRRSSELDIDPGLRGQTRVLAIARAVGATHYVNSPGGRELYDAAEFEEQGIQLSFLPDYRGRFFQLLPALVGSDLEGVRRDVAAPGGDAPS